MVNDFLLQVIIIRIVKVGPPINWFRKCTIPLLFNWLIFVNLSLGMEITFPRVLSFSMFYLKSLRLPLLLF